MKTLYMLFYNQKKINETKDEFIRKTIDGELQKEEDEINQRLAQLGYSI